MSLQNPLRTELKIYTTLERSFIQLASSRTSSLREHLRSHGIQLLWPQSVTMSIHSMELPANVDLTAVQLLIDQWAKDQRSPTPAPAPQPAEPNRQGSRTTMFGPK